MRGVPHFIRNNMNEIKFTDLGLLAKKGMHTPWGTADSVEAKSADKSVIKVSTSSHGGIGVHIPTHPIPEHFKQLGILGDIWAWFEEDCCWAAPVVMFPQCFPSEQVSAESTLRSWYPEVYAAHYGRMPTAEESMVVRAREIKERLKDFFTVSTTWGDWAWDVPRGHIYVLGKRSRDGVEAGFLLPDEAYKAPIDVTVLDAYPRWEPDRSLPYTKPRYVNVAQPTSGSA